jgi:hypothetical protein
MANRRKYLEQVRATDAERLRQAQAALGDAERRRDQADEQASRVRSLVSFIFARNERNGFGDDYTIALKPRRS